MKFASASELQSFCSGNLLCSLSSPSKGKADLAIAWQLGVEAGQSPQELQWRNVVQCKDVAVMGPDEHFQEFLSGTEHSHCLSNLKKLEGVLEHS